jgi:hypothetical protein
MVDLLVIVDGLAEVFEGEEVRVTVRVVTTVQRTAVGGHGLSLAQSEPIWQHFGSLEVLT